jgi:hypothetical protein
MDLGAVNSAHFHKLKIDQIYHFCVAKYMTNFELIFCASVKFNIIHTEWLCFCMITSMASKLLHYYGLGL